MTRDERIRGGLLGLLVGDALGVPYEFHDPRNLPPHDQVEMEPPVGFRRSHPGTPVGTWSDDGAQALALLDSLLSCRSVDVEDFGRRLLDWSERGAYAVDGRVFDIGNQTTTAVAALLSGGSAHTSGPSGERDNGNGSLMRILPLALWHRGTDADLIADAIRTCLPTHGHRRAHLCCALYVVWARGLLDQRPDPWTAATDAVRAVFALDAPGTAELESQVLAPFSPRGSGYVVDTLWSARTALAAGSYEDAVRRAIRFGLDTDTTACVTGGLAGLRDGVGAIPGRWLRALRGRELVEPLLERLLASG